MKYLIDKNEKAVSKEELFTESWETAYLDDMNTLYIYISFLREALEKGSSSPHYLITIRGKGRNRTGSHWIKTGHALDFTNDHKIIRHS